MPSDSTFASTLTEIANLALRRLGEPAQNLLTNSVLADDTTVHSDVVRDHIYIIIRSLQTHYDWDALHKSVTLTSPTDLSDNDNYDWAYSYNLPDDFVAHRLDQSYEYEIMENKIFCNIEDELTAFKYRAYSVDPADWPQTLIDVTILKLAQALCMPITENDKKYELITNEFERITLPKAERVDSYNKKYPNSRRKTGRYAEARGRYRGYGPDDRRQY